MKKVKTKAKAEQVIRSQQLTRAPAAAAVAVSVPSTPEPAVSPPAPTVVRALLASPQPQRTLSQPVL
jgi:hypothetical protein